MSDHFKFPGERERTATTRELGTMRQFETGATRNDDTTKPDYDGYLSPLVIARFGEYMTAHRVQADGSVRDSDNWQKGIPTDAYRKSLNRHHLDAWLLGRGYAAVDHDSGEQVKLEDALMGVLFNAMGWAHEVLKQRGYLTQPSVYANVGADAEFDADREGWQ